MQQNKYDTDNKLIAQIMNEKDENIKFGVINEK